MVRPTWATPSEKASPKEITSLLPSSPRSHWPFGPEALWVEGAEELAPDGLGIAVAYADPQHLEIAQGIDTDRHDHRP